MALSPLQIASYVNKSAMDTAVLQRSLAILESMVLNSQDLYYKVAQEITIGQLIPHLQGCVARPPPAGVRRRSRPPAGGSVSHPLPFSWLQGGPGHPDLHHRRHQRSLPEGSGGEATGEPSLSQTCSPSSPPRHPPSPSSLTVFPYSARPPGDGKAIAARFFSARLTDDSVG